MSTAYIVRTRVEPSYDAEWNRWQTDEHIPNLLALPGYLGVQRFVSTDPSDRQYLNVWRLESAAAFGTPQYRQASLTAWFDRLRPHYRVTVDFGIERETWPGGPTSSGDVGALVVDRVRSDGSAQPPSISTTHLEVIRTAADGIVQIVILDPLEPDHVRSARDAPASEVALIFTSSRQIEPSAPPSDIERLRYVALGARSAG